MAIASGTSLMVFCYSSQIERAAIATNAMSKAGKPEVAIEACGLEIWQ